jgi:hypothetical protein
LVEAGEAEVIPAKKESKEYEEFKEYKDLGLEPPCTPRTP